MAILSTEQAAALISDRVKNYAALALVNVVGVAINLWFVLAHAATATTAGKAAIVLSILAVAAVAILPVRSLFQDIAALREDIAANGGAGAYGREVASKPIPLFINLTIGFNVLIAAVQIWALYGG